MHVSKVLSLGTCTCASAETLEAFVLHLQYINLLPEGTVNRPASLREWLKRATTVDASA